MAANGQYTSAPGAQQFFVDFPRNVGRTAAPAASEVPFRDAPQAFDWTEREICHGTWLAIARIAFPDAKTADYAVISGPGRGSSNAEKTP